MKSATIFDTALGTTNLGDEIIMDSIYRNMNDIFDSYFSLRLATHVTNFTSLQLLRHLLKANWKIKYYQNTDIKFICGTNLINQREAIRINTQWCLYPTNVSLYKNSVLIGVGTRYNITDMNFLSVYLYKRILSQKYAHSVRDDLTKNLIEQLGVKAINTGCPTLWEFTEEKCAKIPKSKSKNCIISVSGYRDQKNPLLDQKMIDIVSKNYEKIWVWIQTTIDEGYLDTLAGTENFERIYSLNKYRNILNNVEVDYVGTRLHGGIFALQNNRRAIIISIDHRAEGFHKTNNIPIVKRNDDINDALNEKINSSWNAEIIIDQDKIREFKEQF